MRLPNLGARSATFAQFLLFSAIFVSPALTQEPTPAATINDSVEVLTRGPIHEAFAEPVAFDPSPGAVVAIKPPESIRELPPEVKPAGDVIWIEGYWLFEVERNDFVWVSGVWRVPPRGRRWVPGYWADVEGGHQWTSGFWIGNDADELGYLTPPPQSLENGSTSPSPSDVYFWVPGCWLNHEGEYSWRPGFWTGHHPSWVWVPDRYVWTPRGCIFVPGYWDHRLADRGTLFAPVHLATESRHANYLYTPDCVIGGSNVYLHLWVRSSDRHYCFGDYYGHDHSGHGIHRWYDYHRNRHGYCPLYVNYMHRHRHHAGEHLHRMTAWHRYFTKHQDRRPRHTLSGQREFERRHRGDDHARHSLLGRTLNDAVRRPHRRDKFVGVSRAARNRLADEARRVRQVTGERRRGERQPGRGPGGLAAAASGRGQASLQRGTLNLPRVERHALRGVEGSGSARSAANRQRLNRSGSSLGSSLGGRPDFPPSEFSSPLTSGQGRNKTGSRSAGNVRRSATERSPGVRGGDLGAVLSRGGNNGSRVRAARDGESRAGGRPVDRGGDGSRGRASSRTGSESRSGTMRRSDGGSGGRSLNRSTGVSGSRSSTRSSGGTSARSSNRARGGSGGQSLSRGGGGSGGRSFSRGAGGRSSPGRSSGGSRSGGNRGGRGR